MEKDEFRVYYETYYMQALKYTVKKVSNIPVAEDLVMETFVSCFKRFDEFDSGRAKFSTWLYVALNNRIKNYYRDNKVYDSIDEHLELAGEEDELLQIVQVNIMRKNLYDALKTLPELQRKMIILKFFKGKTSKEIADSFGMREGTVRVQISRTLEKLRDYFKKNNIEWEE